MLQAIIFLLQGGVPLIIGDDVTIGHGVIHACTIEDQCLIGIGKYNFRWRNCSMNL